MVCGWCGWAWDGGLAGSIYAGHKGRGIRKDSNTTRDSAWLCEIRMGDVPAVTVRRCRATVQPCLIEANGQECAWV